MKIKILFLFFALVFSVSVSGQSSQKEQYDKAMAQIKSENYSGAYKILKELEAKCDKKDTLYQYILWYYVASISDLEKDLRAKEDWANSLPLGIDALEKIRQGLPLFDENFASREAWMVKNIVVSYFGLGKRKEAKPYQDFLYKAYQAKKLPKGINEYYNFEFFKFENKNIWAYEWYPELGDPETEGSYSKMVYYVYSTNPDGTDKDQLYRLHVLKFHKFDNSVKFDYVLTKRVETAKNETDGTLYAYTYERPVDYVKLHEDIIEVLKGNYEPDAKTVVKKKK